MEKLIYKIADGTERFSADTIDGTNSSEVEIHIPKSVNAMLLITVKGNDDLPITVYYDGNKEEWLKIRKGKLDVKIIRHDWYGYYNHNCEGESERKEKYNNWILNRDGIKVVCRDGEIFDYAEKNKSNPAEVSHDEYWAD